MEPTAVLLETQYLPCIQYLSKFIGFASVLIEQHEHYSKGSYRNRCHIAGPNGILRLSIPLKKGKNEQMPIRDVGITYEEPWQKQHWSTIKTAYGNAPFFEHYAEELIPFFEKKYSYLFDFNLELLQTLLQLLQIEDKINLSTAYHRVPVNGIVDFRNGISPKAKKVKPDPGFNTVKYPQVFEERNGFLPNLSILDLLFCTGPQAVFILENGIAKY